LQAHELAVPPLAVLLLQAQDGVLEAGISLLGDDGQPANSLECQVVHDGILPVPVKNVRDMLALMAYTRGAGEGQQHQLQCVDLAYSKRKILDIIARHEAALQLLNHLQNPAEKVKIIFVQIICSSRPKQVPSVADEKKK
jgi:hypothetical protein